MSKQQWFMTLSSLLVTCFVTHLVGCADGVNRQGNISIPAGSRARSMANGSPDSVAGSEVSTQKVSADAITSKAREVSGIQSMGASVAVSELEEGTYNILKTAVVLNISQQSAFKGLLDVSFDGTQMGASLYYDNVINSIHVADIPVLASLTIKQQTVESLIKRGLRLRLFSQTNAARPINTQGRGTNQVQIQQLQQQLQAQQNNAATGTPFRAKVEFPFQSRNLEQFFEGLFASAPDAANSSGIVYKKETATLAIRKGNSQIALELNMPATRGSGTYTVYYVLGKASDAQRNLWTQPQAQPSPANTNRPTGGGDSQGQGQDPAPTGDPSTNSLGGGTAG